jgi:superfamily II DNA helicase RecQ
MQFKIFQIGISGDAEAEAEMNKFLRSHRIVTVQRELTRTVSGSYWCFCVEYIDKTVSESPSSGFSNSPKKNERVDYKEVLSENDFAIFSKIRELRKELASAESVPVYTVCTNDHLAQMVLKHCSSLSALQQISGFGDAKIQKYGQHFLNVLQPFFKEDSEHETSGTTH